MIDNTELLRLSAETLSKRIKATAAQTLLPPPKLSLSEWADAHRFLSSESSAEPGRWITSRAEYQREMMDVLTNPSYQEIVYCTSAQIGKSEIINNILLYHIQHDPCPILLLQPTIQMAQSYSKDRISPAIRDTHCVSDLISDTKSKDSSNTILSKSFPGGTLNLAGANSPASLASRPVRLLLCDEVDRYPLSAASEGDPLQLAIRRTQNFYNRKIVMVSTPTDEATSRIWARYQASDRREYHIRCVHCSHNFKPLWEHVSWTKDNNNIHSPDTALLVCPVCGAGHNDTQRNQAVRYGHWVITNPASKVAGFHLSALISPWSCLENLVTEWLSCQKDKNRLKTFVNTILGEVYKTENSEDLSDINLISRVEDYTVTNLPKNIVYLTAGVDTQQDRLEMSVYGYGENQEIWHIEHKVIHTSPSNPAAWRELEELLKTKYKREDGYILPISSACIDSGYATNDVYNFCSKHTARRWFAIKGRQGQLSIFPKTATRTDKGKVYIVGVDTAKEKIYTQLKNENRGAGYIHFSEDCDIDFFEQLTSERKVIKYKNGYAYYVWKKESSVRNEPLDCFVYSLAASESLNINTKFHKQKQESRLAESKNETKKEIEAPIAENKNNVPAWKRNLQSKRSSQKWL